jgi:hypothetical protein
MTPLKNPGKGTYDQELRERVRLHISPDGDALSIQQLSNRVHYSRPALSRYISGQYDNPEQIEEALRAYFTRLDRIGTGKHAVVPTLVVKMINEALEFALDEREIVVISGRPSMGKTTAVQSYLLHQRPTAGRNIVYVCANATMRQAGLAHAIAEDLGMSRRPAATRLWIEIARHLAKSPHLIIIDDASHLNLQAIEMLRWTHDQSACGLVLIGTTALMDRMLGATGRMAEDLAQFYERVGLPVELPESLSREEMKAIGKAHDGALSDRDLDAVTAKGRRPRQLVKLLRRISRLRALNSGASIADLLPSAESQMFEFAA